MKTRISKHVVCLSTLLPLFSWAVLLIAQSPAAAQSTQPAGHSPVKIADTPTTLPDELQGIGIEEHLNTPLPLDLQFTDEDGRPVKLGQYFTGKRPVILTLVYYGCPMLCGLVLNAQMEAMRDLKDWTPGQEYEVVTVSFDPSETPRLASLKKQNYLKAFGKPAAVSGWHFLTGRQEEIHRLTGVTGFKYRWDERNKQFVHAPAIMIVTSDGRLSRYLHGVMFDPKVLRLSLVEAGQGKIGTTMDHVFLYCFKYDPSKRAYTLAAVNIMKLAGALTVLAVAAWLVPAWVRRPRPTGNDGGPSRAL